MIPRFSGICLGLVFMTTVSFAAEPNVSSQTAFINEQIAAKWKEAEIKKPAARANDFEFIRRVFIDMIGRIATPEEVLDFENDKSSDKRAKLIKRLMNEDKYQPRINGVVIKPDGKKALTFNYVDAYADHWSNLWTIWLMSRSVEDRYRTQMRDWLQTQLDTDVSGKEINHKEMVTAILTATGRSNQNGAVNFIALQMGEKNAPEKRMELGTFDAVPITSRVTRLFLGLQTQCTQCHDHPFNKEWVQSDFWGVNAFFRQINRSADPTPKVRMGNNQMMAPLVQVSIDDTTDTNVEGRIYYERRDGQLKSIKPTFLKDVAQADKGDKSDKFLSNIPDAKNRREALAKFVVSHDNFAKAYVNRIWGHFFGRGLCKDAAVDDFGSHNEVVHPELLNKLAEEFAKYNYNPKLLAEWICNSDAYQLSHVANKDYVDPKYEPYFARMPLKAMSPETLFDAISTATKSDSVEAVNRKARNDAREAWLNKLVAQFGDDEGNEMVFNGTIVQALLMMNGRELNSEIGIGGANPVRKVVEKHSKSGSTNVSAVIDELFLMTLNRHPTPEEKIKITNLQQKGAILKAETSTMTGTPTPAKTPAPVTPPAKGPAGKGPVAKGPNKGPVPKLPAAPPGVVLPSAPSDVTFYQDLFWALLNTNEFMLNH